MKSKLQCFQPTLPVREVETSPFRMGYSSTSSTIVLPPLYLLNFLHCIKSHSFLHLHQSTANISCATTFPSHPLDALFSFFHLFSDETQSFKGSLCCLVCFYHDPLQLLCCCTESERLLHGVLVHRESLKCFHHLSHVLKIWQLSQTSSGWPVCSQPNHNHHNTLLIIIIIK